MLLSLFVAAASAQTLTLGGASFDIGGCVDPSGVNTCASQAQTTELQGYGTCNGTSDKTACLVGVSANYYQDVIGCMAGGCWNRALNCDFQLMLAAYANDIIHEASLVTNVPPFYISDYKNYPGQCVCNFRQIQEEFLIGIISDCANSGDVVQCDCCAAGQRYAKLQSICPNNTMEPLGYTKYTGGWQSGIEYCTGYQQANWHDIYEQQCPNLGVQPANNSAGFLNPLSLPAGFPGTAPLTDVPGPTATAISQYDVSTDVLTWSWLNGVTKTISFASYNNAAATQASGSSQTTAQLTTIPGATTTIHGQVSTIAPSVATASASKSSAADKLAVPACLLMGMLLF